MARAYRFIQGSGLPVRIPVIELVEIGAGGGSIARLDALGRIQVGPDSSGSVPGPACYGRGGTEPTVTDADTALGRLDPSRFAGGSIPLYPEKAAKALESINANAQIAAAGVAEIVDETMASAARVHAVENGKDTGERTLIAFGGAAPLHAARLARKLGMKRVVVPVGAGVGSAHGFLRAPIAYEVVRTRHMRVEAVDGIRRALHLQPPDIGRGVKDLPLQVGEFEAVMIHQPNAAHPRRRQIKRQRRAEPPRAHHQHPGRPQPGLAHGTHLTQQDVPGVAVEFSLGEVEVYLVGCDH